ncbi:MAG: phosphatase [Acidobacteria bacterium]|nr:MAG: phosphatase [Acidobacteriota bacterium]
MTRDFYCDAVLLDMDGTLVDSTESVIRHWRIWTERHHLDLDKVLEFSHGRPTLETMKLVAPHLASVEEVRWLEAVESADQDGIKAVRGALPFVAALPTDRWAVVTSAPRRIAGERLSHAGIPMPSTLVCSDDVQKGKPDPEPYLRAAGLLGVAPERCLVFEDAPVGIESARSAGMEVVGLTTTFPPEKLGARICLADFAGVSVDQVVAADDALRISLP